MPLKQHRPCEICGQVDAKRPSLETSEMDFPFPENDLLSRFCNARLHIDCLGPWAHRRRLSQGYAEVERLEAAHGFRLVLAEGEGWLLTCGEPGLSRVTTMATVLLEDWPIRLLDLSRLPWPNGLIEKSRRRLAGAALEALERAMAEILLVAPNAQALDDLRRLAQRKNPPPPARDWDLLPWCRGGEPLPAVTEAERLTLEQLGAALHARGWASHVTVANLLRSWRRFTRNIAQSRFMPEEFANSLSGRDALAEVLAECPAPLAAKLSAVVSAADDAYRAATRDDGGRSLRAFWGGMGQSWWWLRRPIHGPLSDALDAHTGAALSLVK